MALTQISTQGIKDGTITGSDLATNVDLVDNQKLRLGASQDLQIYHDSSNSYIKDSGTGDLLIGGDANVSIINSAASEFKAKFITNGAVELYHNNEKKLNTTAGGVQVTGDFATTGSGGTITANENLKIPNDTGKLLLGASNDLQIYHDGSNSYIAESGTGDLIITSNTIRPRTDTFVVNNAANNQNMISAVNGSSVELFHNGSKKFETTSSGIAITGGLTVSGIAEFANTINLTHASANQNFIYFNEDLQFARNGTGTRLKIDSSGRVLIGTTSPNSFNGVGGEHTLIVAGSTADTDITDNSGAALTISNTDGTANNTAGLHFAREDNDGVPHYTGASIVAQFKETMNTGEYPKASLSFLTSVANNNAPSEKMRISPKGQVSIKGTTSSFDTTGSINGLQLYYETDSGIATVGTFSDGGATGLDFHTNTGGGPSAQRMRIDHLGNIGAPNGTNIYNASDSRVKKNIVDLNKGLSAIKSLRPVSFNWIDGYCDEEKDTLYGFIAQEVKAVDSNLIQDFATELTIDDNKIENVLRVNEKFIIPMLVKAVQELSAKVETLKTEVASLKGS